MGATNRPEALDPALLRAGRLDLQLKVDLPDQASRLAILQVHNSDRPLADNIDLLYWATQTEGWNGADLSLLSNQAALEPYDVTEMKAPLTPTQFKLQPTILLPHINGSPANDSQFRESGMGSRELCPSKWKRL